MFGNQIRFTGMSSGMDTQTIVQQLMRAESMRMDRMTRRRQLAMWRQEQFRDIATNLRTFRDEHLSQVGRTNNIMRAATFRAWETSVTMSGIADPNSALHRGITVTTNPDAQAGTFDFRVNTLVQNAAIHGHTAANRAAPPSATTNVGGGTNMTGLGFFAQPRADRPSANTIVTNSRDRISTENAPASWQQTANGWSSVRGGYFDTVVTGIGQRAQFEGHNVYAHGTTLFIMRDNEYIRVTRDPVTNNFQRATDADDNYLPPLNFRTFATTNVQITHNNVLRQVQQITTTGGDHVFFINAGDEGYIRVNNVPVPGAPAGVYNFELATTPGPTPDDPPTFTAFDPADYAAYMYTAENVTRDSGAIPTPVAGVPVNVEIEFNNVFRQVQQFGMGSETIYFIAAGDNNYIRVDRTPVAGSPGVYNFAVATTPGDPDAVPPIPPEPIALTADQLDAMATAVIEPATRATTATVGHGQLRFDVQSFTHGAATVFFATINGVHREVRGSVADGFQVVANNATPPPLQIINRDSLRTVHEQYYHTQVWREVPNQERTPTNERINSVPNVVGWDTHAPGASGDYTWRGVDGNGYFLTNAVRTNLTFEGVAVRRITAGPGTGYYFAVIGGRNALLQRDGDEFTRWTQGDFFAAYPEMAPSGWPTGDGHNPNDYAYLTFNPAASTNVFNYTQTQFFVSTITINNTDINIRSYWNVNQVMNAINNSAAGVEMRLTNGQFTLTSRTTGAGGNVNITADEAGFMTWALGLDSSHNATAERTLEGQNASAQVRREDGVWRNLAFNPNRPNIFTYANHTISLAGAEVGQVFTIETTRDMGAVDRTMEAIRDFVEQYNALVMMLQTAHSTNRPRSVSGGQRSFFEPLLDAERRDMSDREIERWEEQARKGLLFRDSTLRNIQAQMRRQINDGVLLPGRTGNAPGDHIFLHEIGITTGGVMPGQAANQLNIGLLQINEDRLRAAIEGSPELVETLFTANPQNATARQILDMPANQRAQVGLAHRLDAIIFDATRDTGRGNNREVGSLTRMAGHANFSQDRLSRQIHNYDRRLDRMQDWLIRREQQLFRQFSMMEQAMARSHSQMDSLFMFGMN